MSKFLPKDLYQTIVDHSPILCVDVVPVNLDTNKITLGCIVRNTGSQKGKLALIGGRVYKDELIPQAIERHLITDLKITDWQFHPANTEFKPYFVAQYLHSDHAEFPYTFDPTKHSVALTYLITMKGDPKPQEEAAGFQWLTKANFDTNAFGFNHGYVMDQAFQTMEQYRV